MNVYNLTHIKKILDDDFKIEGNDKFIRNISSPGSSSDDSLIWLNDSFILEKDFPRILASFHNFSC